MPRQHQGCNKVLAKSLRNLLIRLGILGTGTLTCTDNIAKLIMNTNNTISEVQTEQHYQFVYRVSGVIGTTICSIGMLTNVMNIVIFTLMIRSFSTVTNMFLLAMAFFDLAILAVYMVYSICCIILPEKPIIQEYDIPIDYIGTFQYNLFYVWHIPANAFLIISTWYMVSLMVFRFFAVYFPLRAYKLCSVARTRFTLIIVALVGMASVVPDFFTIQIVDAGSYGKILLYNYDVTQNELFNNIYYNYLEAVNSYLPFTICLIFGGFLMKALHKSALLIRKSGSIKHKVRRTNDQRRISVMLLAINIWFLLCTTPSVVFRSMRHSVSQGSHEDELQWYKLRATADVCHLLYCSTNFLLYAFTNRAYRKRLHYLLLQLNCIKVRYHRHMKERSFRSSYQLSYTGWSKRCRQKTASTNSKEVTVNLECSTACRRMDSVESAIEEQSQLLEIPTTK